MNNAVRTVPVNFQNRTARFRIYIITRVITTVTCLIHRLPPFSDTLPVWGNFQGKTIRALLGCWLSIG